MQDGAGTWNQNLCPDSARCHLHQAPGSRVPGAWVKSIDQPELITAAAGRAPNPSPAWLSPPLLAPLSLTCSRLTSALGSPRAPGLGFAPLAWPQLALLARPLRAQHAWPRHPARMALARPACLASACPALASARPARLAASRPARLTSARAACLGLARPARMASARPACLASACPACTAVAFPSRLT